MSKIRIKHFGPIKEGYLSENEDGWLDIKKVTVFIGNQGSGKSTVAKLISTMTWIEKALVREDFSEIELEKYNRFKKHIMYQNIGSYFNDNSLIEYHGKAYDIYYAGGNVSVKKKEKNGYSFPKIMYVPAERNFASSVANVRTLKGLPSTLYTFSDEYINAIEDMKGQITLPINNIKFEFQKLNKLAWIVGEDYKIKLSESSSGFQSFVPLYIVTRFLINSIKDRAEAGTKHLSIEDEKRIRKELAQILTNPNISDEVKQASLEFLSSKFRYSSLVNIVEEPEQNLFPSSQWQILKSLLEFNNMNEGNKLIMTTHSPYIVNYLNIAVQGHNLKEKIDNANTSNNLTERLNSIIPLSALCVPDDLVVYQLDESTGTIKRLETFEGVVTDKNYLNQIIRQGNELFDSLLEIEEEL
jgi:predicted ATPase